MKVVGGTATIDDVDAFVAALDDIGDASGCAMTAFDARYVAGRRHLEAAVDRANRAFERDDAIADDRGVEILLYAAGRRQIERALEMGVGEGRGPVVVVVDGGFTEDDAPAADEVAAADAVAELLEPADVLGTERDEERIRAFFDVSDAELGATDATLEALVVERVSLLVIEK